MDMKLMGYVRKSNDGKCVRVTVSKNAFDKASTYRQDGTDYVTMVINLKSLLQVIDGQKEVTGVNQTTRQ